MVVNVICKVRFLSMFAVELIYIDNMFICNVKVTGDKKLSFSIVVTVHTGGGGCG